jgi:hypothetical protein
MVRVVGVGGVVGGSAVERVGRDSDVVVLDYIDNWGLRRADVGDSPGKLVSLDG